MAVALKPSAKFGKKSSALVSGITSTADDKTKILSKFQTYSYDNILYRLAFSTVTFGKVIGSDAALGFGQDLFTLPTGIIAPLHTTLKMTSLAPTGLSATAGEVGLGTTVATGAIATLGAGSAAMENVMEGTTLANHVADTTLVSEVANTPVAAFDHGAAGSFGVIDATAGTSKVYLNLASTWNQTSTESVAFQVDGVFTFMVLGSDFGVE